MDLEIEKKKTRTQPKPTRQPSKPNPARPTPLFPFPVPAQPLIRPGPLSLPRSAQRGPGPHFLSLPRLAHSSAARSRAPSCSGDGRAHAFSPCRAGPASQRSQLPSLPAWAAPHLGPAAFHVSTRATSSARPARALRTQHPPVHAQPSSPSALARPRPTPLAALPDPHVSFGLFLPRLPLAQQKSAGDLAVICSLGAHAQDRLSHPVFSAPCLWNPDPHLATPPQTLARDPPCRALCVAAFPALQGTSTIASYRRSSARRPRASPSPSSPT